MFARGFVTDEKLFKGLVFAVGLADDEPNRAGVIADLIAHGAVVLFPPQQQQQQQQQQVVPSGDDVILTVSVTHVLCQLQSDPLYQWVCRCYSFRVVYCLCLLYCLPVFCLSLFPHLQFVCHVCLSLYVSDFCLSVCTAGSAPRQTHGQQHLA